MKKENIELLSWLKNNETWYVPTSKALIDINSYFNFEVLHYFNDDNFLVFCWHENKADGRLFKAKLKSPN